MSDNFVDSSISPPEAEKTSGPNNRILITVLVAIVLILLCGACMFFIGPLFGDSLALAAVCTVRSVDTSGDTAQKCTDWAVDVVLNHTDEYNQCEAARENIEPGVADDAVMLCLEDQGLGPP